MIKIVIIEDLPIILEGIKILINQIEDFNVVAEFNNGKDFIDHLEQINTDIVLIDIEMPVINGITATKMALASRPNLKVIALSMHDDQRYYYEMITAGAKGFVLKQATIDELEAAIREVHEGGSFFSKDLLHGVIMGMQAIEKTIAEERKVFLKLSERELQLLQLLCQGLTNKELAEKMFVSVRTIESTKNRLMQKTSAKNTAGLIIWSIKNNIVSI